MLITQDATRAGVPRALCKPDADRRQEIRQCAAQIAAGDQE